MIRANQMIAISIDGGDPFLAKVEHVMDTATMPDELVMAQAIFNGSLIDQMAVITLHRRAGSAVATAIVHIEDGWYDLCRRRVTLAPWRPS